MGFSCIVNSIAGKMGLVAEKKNVTRVIWGLAIIQRHNSNRLHMSAGSRWWMHWMWYGYIPSVGNVRHTLISGTRRRTEILWGNNAWISLYNVNNVYIFLHISLYLTFSTAVCTRKRNLFRRLWWTRVNTGEHGWIRVNTGEHEWTRVNTGEHGWTRVNTDEHGWTRMNTGEHGWTRVNTRLLGIRRRGYRCRYSSTAAVALQNAYLRIFHRKRHAYSYFSRHTYHSSKWRPCLLSDSLLAVLWSHEYSHDCAHRYT